MNKYLKSIVGVGLVYVTMVSCTKEEATPAPVKVTYTKDIKTIFVTNCTPCHLASGTHAKKWEDYATAKANITGILDRIQRDKAATGFMPRGKDPLPAATIALIKQWQADGLLEN